MTALTVLPGGGETTATPECQICGVAHNRPCAVLGRHVQHLRLAGYDPGSIRNRRSALARLAAALPVSVVDADAAMLAQWQAGLTLTTRKAIANYTAFIADFYAWAVTDGSLPGGDPSAGLRRRGGRPGDGAALPAPAERYLAWLRLRGHSEMTIYGRRRALIRMSAALGVPLPEATAEDLLAWRAGLAVSDATLVHYVSAAREIYGWLHAEGLRPDNPAARLPVPRLARRIPRPIKESDLMAAVDCAPARIRPWLVLGGWCAMRAVEIALLLRSNILDGASPPVIVIASGATKGRADERVIPMSGFVAAELAAAGLPASGYAFTRRDGGKGPNSPGLISHLANDFLHSIGIADTLHSLRHRCLSEIYRNTLDLRLTQEIAGHASPATTAGYTKIANASAVAAVESLGVPGLRAVR